MVSTFLESVAVVTLSEMGDKTQLLALALAARFNKPLPILGGILVATLTNHFLAALVGHATAQFLTGNFFNTLLGLSFILFGIWTLKPDTFDEKTVSDAKARSVFWTTTVLFFLAEMGDKTQLATLALGAKYQDPFAVTASTTLGMMIADGGAVWFGTKLTHRLNFDLFRKLAASLFFVLGVLTLLKPLF